MSQTDGGLTVDKGHRPASAGGGAEDPSRSRVEERADGADASTLGALTVVLWFLPGFGERGPRCGEWYAEAVCDSCADLSFGTHDCGRRGCPECWAKWAREAAMARTVRLQARRLAEPANYKRQSGHFVYSPGWVPQTVEDIKELRREAAETAKEKGLRGCDVVVHPFRTTAEANRMYREADPEIGKWVWLRQNFPERMTMEADDPLMEWSPHAHVIGLMSPDMEAGTDESDVWQLLSTFGPLEGKRDQEAHQEVYGAYRYLLSHTAMHEREQFNAVTGYGDLSNVKFTDYRPSPGVMSVLEREVEEAVGSPLAREEEGDGGGGEDDEERRRCDRDGCEGELIEVFDVPAYLEQCDPPPEVREAMQLAHDWRLGEVVPPPGLMHPSSEEEARETWSVLKEKAGVSG